MGSEMCIRDRLRAALIEQFGETEVRKGFVKTYTYNILNHHNEINGQPLKQMLQEVELEAKTKP